MIYELKCSVCGFKTGELDLPEEYKGELTNEALGLEVKCDEHK